MYEFYYVTWLQQQQPQQQPQQSQPQQTVQEMQQQTQRHQYLEQVNARPAPTLVVDDTTSETETVADSDTGETAAV